MLQTISKDVLMHKKIGSTIILALICASCTIPRTPTSVAEKINLGQRVPQSLTMIVSGKTYNVWKVQLSWRCNAEGGGWGSVCEGRTIVPNPDGTHLPVDHIHCRTETTIIKKDSDTFSEWRVSRGPDNSMAFYHHIRAQSQTFGGGKEIEVSFTHYVIAEKDKDALSAPLSCSFTTAERV